MPRLMEPAPVLVVTRYREDISIPPTCAKPVIALLLGRQYLPLITPKLMALVPARVVTHYRAVTLIQHQFVKRAIALPAGRR